MAQIVTKTYSRRRLRQTDMTHAERTFDEVFHGANRPPARAAATAEKWGTASFRRISNATRSSPKHRLSPTRCGDDPFSFDSDDDNIAKKSKKENVQQKTLSGTVATKHTAAMTDGKYSFDTARPVGGKSSRVSSFKDKSSAESCVRKRQTRVDDIEGHAKQHTEKLPRNHISGKAKVRSVDCAADWERNGVSACNMMTRRVSGRGDSQELNEKKCRSNGVESRSCCDKKPAAGDAKITRSSGVLSPCKTTEQLKVFVDNFSQLISSQRVSTSRRSELSPHSKHDSPVTKSEGSENCFTDSGHLHLSPSHRAACDRPRTVSPEKKRTACDRPRTVSAEKKSGASLTALLSRHSKQLHQGSSSNDDSDDDDDDDDDDDSVILLSPLQHKTEAMRAVGSSHEASVTSRTVVGRDSTSCRQSSSTNINSRLSTDNPVLKSDDASATDKNEAVSSKVDRLRSHRRMSRNECTAGSTGHGESVTTTTSCISTTTSTTRRLLTGSRKVLYINVPYIYL